jgi:lambda family phage portal protein
MGKFSSLYRRAIERLTGTRSSDTRRWASAPRTTNLNSYILQKAALGQQQATWLFHENPWVRRAVRSYVANAVGCGIRPRSQHPDPAVRQRLQELWDQWVQVADPGGLTDHYGQQAMAVKQMLEAGEIFGRFRTRYPSDRVPTNFQLELLHKDQIPVETFAELTGNSRIRAGIEFDTIGRRVAYHALPARPGDPYVPVGLAAYRTVRVPAEDMLHLLWADEPGQLRGLTSLMPSLLRVNELDQAEDAALVRAKVAAMFVGQRDDQDGTGFDGSTPIDGRQDDIALEPGTVYTGPAINFSQPPEWKDYPQFVKSHLRAVAAGIGVPYEHVSQDYEGVTYSSMRSALLEFRGQVAQLQWTVVIPLFCRPVWSRFVRMAVLSGDLPARDFYRNPAPYLSANFIPPRWDWVDPANDTKAEIEAINARLKSRAAAVAERGYDVEQVDAEIAADQAREKALGIAPAATDQGNADA